MSLIRKIFLLSLVSALAAGCASQQACKCDVPGPALVKVFMADDDKPNVNIETLTVYPGQKIVFEGLNEFSLDFPIDPQEPEKKQVKFKSKDGKIKIKVSKKFQKILADRSEYKNGEIVKARSNYDSEDPVDYYLIKYDVESRGKVRDPKLKIIMK